MVRSAVVATVAGTILGLELGEGEEGRGREEKGRGRGEEEMGRERRRLGLRLSGKRDQDIHVPAMSAVVTAGEGCGGVTTTTRHRPHHVGSRGHIDNQCRQQVPPTPA